MLLTQSRATGEAIDHAFRSLAWLLSSFGVLAVASGLIALRDGNLRLEWYWLMLVVTVPALLWLVRRSEHLPRSVLAAAWCGLLLADLWALAWPLVEVRAEADVYPPSETVRTLTGDCGGRWRVLDRDQFDPKGGEEQTVTSPLGTGAPLAQLYGIETLRGFNPIDIRRYKEYLQFVLDDDRPLQPMESPLTYPIMDNFPIRNRRLLDLLGVRYLVQPAEWPPDQDGWRLVASDPGARVFDMNRGGIRGLRPYRVYENPSAFPRAFVVPQAAPLPERDRILATLRETPFERRVLLEGFNGNAADSPGGMRQAVVREWQPNRVVVEVPDGPAGYLVLTEVWFPGWKCSVDGQEQRMYRANYLFRGVAVPGGPHRVEFVFSPASYLWGRAISATVLLLLLAERLAAIGKRWRRLRVPAERDANLPAAPAAPEMVSV